MNPTQKQTAIEYYNKGKAKFEQRDYRGAILYYSNAIELNASHIEAFLYRGVAKVFSE